MNPFAFLRTFTLFPLAAVLAGHLAASAAAADSRAEVGVVRRLVGRAETARGPLAENDPLYLGDVVSTPSPAGSTSWLQVDFDRDGELWIGPNTRVTLKPEEQPARCKRERPVAATVRLEEGHVRVAHDQNDPETGPEMVEIHTPSAILCLAGSTVDVMTRRRNSARDPRMFVLVTAGRIVLFPPFEETRYAWDPVHVSANQLLAFDDRGPAQPTPARFDRVPNFLAIGQLFGLLEDSPLQDEVDLSLARPTP